MAPSERPIAHTNKLAPGPLVVKLIALSPWTLLTHLPRLDELPTPSTHHARTVVAVLHEASQPGVNVSSHEGTSPPLRGGPSTVVLVVVLAERCRWCAPGARWRTGPGERSGRWPVLPRLLRAFLPSVADPEYRTNQSGGSLALLLFGWSGSTAFLVGGTQHPRSCASGARPRSFRHACHLCHAAAPVRYFLKCSRFSNRLIQLQSCACLACQSIAFTTAVKI